MNLNHSLRHTPIAVIGLSALFADARNIEEYWTNIVQGRDSITDVPADRWAIDDYYDPDPFAEDKTYCKRGGFIPKIDFNPLEFGLPPNILEVTDASQLLALIAARDALKDAGYDVKGKKFISEIRQKTGVLLGVGGGQKLITPLIARLQYPIWERALRSSGIAEADIPPIIEKMKKAYVSWNENAFPGLLGNVISGRITNRFDLGGINSVVDAACAASLSAVKMALSELVEGRADMMLTGGVDTDNSPFMYMSFSKTPAFSKSNHITPFDKDADGMLIGEGVGMLVLKRLADAERDGDRIYAVVKGVGTSSDGRFKSIYAPRASGQALAVRRTYEEAGYAPHTVDLLEAHGTGTGGGDPVEFESMSSVFSEGDTTKQHIALGSVKSQVGHTKAAAGAAGMIKTVLALHHKVLPPTINVTEPNPKFNIKDSAIYVNTEARPWLRDEHPRRASVSAFGFGGINVHIAMEEYAAENAQPYRLHTPYKTVLLHAATPQQLLNICQSHLTNLQEVNNAADTLHKITQPQNVPASAARLGFICSNAEDAATLLQTAIAQLQKNQTAWEHPKGIYFRDRAMPTEGKVVALFSGQGSQYVGMGKEISNAFPTVRQSFAQANDIFTKENRRQLSKTVFPIPVFNNEDKKAQQLELTKTQNAQPAIGTLSMGLFKVLKNAGLKIDFAAGHSFGELTALWAAGVYDDQTFIQLATKRGEAMGTPNTTGDAGTMLAVKANLQQVQQEVKNLTGVKIANINSPTQVILGGSTSAIRAAEQQLQQRGYSVLPLPVAAAFHTELVAHAQRPFAAFIAQQQFNAPQVPVFANATAQPYPNLTFAIKKQLQEQILQPVHFQQQIENIYQRGGRIFIEFGPKGVLTNLTKSILADKNDVTTVALNPNAKRDSDQQFRQAIVQLQILGLPLAKVDKYELPKIAPAPKTKLTIGMGGNNYVSPQTQKAYQDVINNGFKVKFGSPQIVEKIVEKPVVKEIEKIVEVEKIVEKIVKVPVEKVVEKIIEIPAAPVNALAANPAIQNQSDMANKEIIQLLQTTVENFQQQQAKTLSVFEQFLKDNHQQTQSLFQLMSEQLQALQTDTSTSITTNGNGSRHAKSTATTNGITANIPPIVDESPVYTNGTTATTEVNYAVQTAPTAVAEAPVLTATPTANTDKLAEILLTVISEKTGYPAEMLELEMDMEADLGIDSIKRVEIFGAMTESYPEVSGINPNELSELRTLQQIVDYIAGNADTAAVTTPTPAVQNTVSKPVSAPATQNNVGINNDKLAETLLTVISEKTGYPAEMLELEMDMEADLGIDSIKRVEIFGAMTEDYPEISGINPNELSELRTLQQIVDYIAQNAEKKNLA